MQLLDITKLSHDGRGIGRTEAGKTIFVDGALPGEKITYEITHTKPRFLEAKVVEVVTESPARVQPLCPHFSSCGGCSQQHISHNAQIIAKQQNLIEQLQHFGKVTPEQILDPITGAIWGYRTKARLGVRYFAKENRIIIGFRQEQKNDIADINGCLTMHPIISTKIPLLKTFIRNLDGYRDIRELEVSVADNHLAIVVHQAKPLSNNDQTQWLNLAQEHAFDLYLQSGNHKSNVKIWPNDNDSRLTYTLPRYNLNMRFHPSDFTQVNQELNREMIHASIELLSLKNTDRVLDLFCGLGNFTLPMATMVHSVVGVEGSEGMVQRGYENAALNSITNANFYVANLSNDQTSALWSKQPYNKILLDPPRSGAAAVLPLIAKIKPEIILYVSCNPATLARDSGVLCNQFNYKLSTVRIVDMFAHTAHIETIALFSRL